jgi:hypothetical protein
MAWRVERGHDVLLLMWFGTGVAEAGVSVTLQTMPGEIKRGGLRLAPLGLTTVSVWNRQSQAAHGGYSVV